LDFRTALDHPGNIWRDRVGSRRREWNRGFLTERRDRTKKTDGDNESCLRFHGRPSDRFHNRLSSFLTVRIFPKGESVVMVVCLLVFRDLLVALSLRIPLAGSFQVGPSRVCRAHSEHRQESFEVMALARGTRRRTRVAHQRFETVSAGSTFEFV
jgi:hypothetical protein